MVGSNPWSNRARTLARFSLIVLAKAPLTVRSRKSPSKYEWISDQVPNGVKKPYMVRPSPVPSPLAALSLRASGAGVQRTGPRNARTRFSRGASTAPRMTPV